MNQIRSFPLYTLRTAAACAALTAMTSAQVTTGTTTVGFLVGDPDSAFAAGLPFPASPEGNPFWEPSHPSRPFVDRQAELGKALFWDEQLSADNTMACGTCHAMKAGGTDIREAVQNIFQKFGSVGVFPQDPDRKYYVEPIFTSVFASPGTANSHKRTTPLFAPSMINAAFFEELFWQKRVGPEFDDINGNPFNPPGAFDDFAALEALAVEPPTSPIEMGHDKLLWESGKIQDKLSTSAILRLARPQTVPANIQYLLGTTYEQAFDDLYGPSSTGNPVTRKRVAMSLAQYMRTLVSDEAPVLLPGGLSLVEKRAFERMRQSSCFSCHSSSENPVVDPNGGFVDKFDGLLSDGGAFRILESPHDMAPDADTGDLTDAFMKVPSLLNLGLRKRFFHSGHIEGIDELISFFNGELSTSPLIAFNPPLSPIEKVGMRELWMHGFVDPRVETATFPFDRPDLQSERLALQGPLENQFGTPTFGVRPLLFSSTPATAGEPWFKAGLTFARAHAVSQFGLSSTVGNGGGGILLGGSIFWSPPLVTDQRGNATWWLSSMSSTPPPGIVGTSWFGQWRTQDSSAPLGMAVTRAARFRIF